MTNRPMILALFTLGLLAVDPVPASAAWNNVFQTTCHGCNSRSSSSFFAPAPAACPTVTYQQRCYYQPVTTYKMQTTYKPVTTYRTSYYWEPVTSYRYTSFYDPCTGCSQRVPVASTSYRLRSQCNPVQSWVQRCEMVPVTETRKSCYLEPVVTYSAPVCPTPCPTCPPSGAISEGSPSPAIPASPGISESTEPPTYLPKQNVPETGGTGLNRRVPTPAPAPTPKAPRFDRMTSLKADGGQIGGMLVEDDRITPKGFATILFVSGANPNVRNPIETDGVGRFVATLAPGEWVMYLPGRDGRPEYHSRIQVESGDARNVLLVSR